MGLHYLHQWLLSLLLLSTNYFIFSLSNSKVTCPQYCKCTISLGMRSAACAGQRLLNIETDVPSNVEIFDLSNNSISSLEREGFKNLGLTSLYKLQLQHNRIGTIDLHAFLGVTKLRILDLSYNHLYYLLPGTFEDTHQLRSLYLQGNRLKINPGPILVIPALEILDISSCQVDRFYHDSFLKLPALLRLNISHNELIKIDVEVLETLVHLQWIDLKRNPWSCDGNGHALNAWLKKHYIQYDEICKAESKDTDKFQRIVSAVDFQNETEVISDDDLLRIWSLEEKNKNLHMEENGESGCVKRNTDILNGGNIFKVFDSIPSFWSLIMGIQIGIVIGGTGMWLLKRFNCVNETITRPVSITRRRNVRSLHNRASSIFRPRNESEDSTALWSEMDIVSCPDTPPPPYRFDNFSRNNSTRHQRTDWTLP